MAYKKKSYKYVVLEVSNVINVFSSHKFGADLLLHILIYVTIPGLTPLAPDPPPFPPLFKPNNVQINAKRNGWKAIRWTIKPNDWQCCH